MRSVCRLLIMLHCAAAAPLAMSEPAAPTLDAAARIEYGWLTGDAAMIRAAGESLEARNRDPWAAYLRAYAAYRAGQLAQADGRPARAELERCEAAAGEATSTREIAAEAELIVAACAALAAAEEPLRAVLHQRRFRQALSRATALDAGNPRLKLVSLRYASPPEGTAEAVVAAFRDSRGRYAFPDWGEAEALVLLGSERLDAGDRRSARDLVEEALLIAPDYADALTLASRLTAQTAAN